MRINKILMVIFLTMAIASSFLNADDKKNDSKQSKSMGTYTVGVPDEMPTCDLQQLQKNVVYPEKAIKSGVEGKVIVKALIGIDGKVKKVKVVNSDSKLLNNSAKQAVKKTLFTPAKKNGSAVEAWVVLPIVFKLK